MILKWFPLQKIFLQRKIPSHPHKKIKNPFSDAFSCLQWFCIAIISLQPINTKGSSMGPESAPEEVLIEKPRSANDHQLKSYEHLDWSKCLQMEESQLEVYLNRLVAHTQQLLQAGFPKLKIGLDTKKVDTTQNRAVFTDLDEAIIRNKQALKMAERLESILIDGVEQLEATSHSGLQNELQNLEKKIQGSYYPTASSETHANLARLRTEIHSHKKSQLAIITRLNLISQALEKIEQALHANHNAQQTDGQNALQNWPTPNTEQVKKKSAESPANDAVHKALNAEEDHTESSLKAAAETASDLKPKSANNRAKSDAQIFFQSQQSSANRVTPSSVQDSSESAEALLPQLMQDRIELQIRIFQLYQLLDNLNLRKFGTLKKEICLLKLVYTENFSRDPEVEMQIQNEIAAIENEIRAAKELQAKDSVKKQKNQPASTLLVHSFFTDIEKTLKDDADKETAQHWAYSSQSALEECRQANVARKTYRSKLDRLEKNFSSIENHYCFWMKDIPSLDMDSFLQLFTDLSSVLVAAKTQLCASKQLCLALFCLIVIRLIMYVSPFFNPLRTERYQTFQHTLQASLGRVTKDRFSFSLQALLWETLFALPNALTLLLSAFYFNWVWSTTPEGAAISNALYFCAFFAFTLDFLHRLSVPNGIFLSHFRWDSDTVTQIFRFYPFVFFFSVLSFGLTSIFSQPATTQLAYSKTLGRFCFILLCLTSLTAKLMSWTKGAFLLLSARKTRTINTMNHMVWSCLCIADLVMAAFALQGYFKVAQIVMFRFEVAFAVWLLSLFGYHLVFRFLFILRRQKAFEMAKIRRAEILSLRARQGEDGVFMAPEVEEPTIDLENLIRRNLELLRFVVLLIGWFGISQVIKPVSPALITALVEIQIIDGWTVASVVDIGLVGFFCYQCYRSLPAFIEIVILPNLDINTESEYNLKQVARYGVLFLSLVSTASLAHINLREQWWLTALSGAAGFGLRDAVLSLLAGGLILILKPLSIGDTITIGSITGVVSQIGSFSCIILDFKKREHFVPNKDFMFTGFTRWTTDMPRITFKLEILTDQSTILASDFLPKLQSYLEEVSGLSQFKAPVISIKSASQKRFEYEILCYLIDSEQVRLLKAQIFENLFAELSKDNIRIENLSVVSAPQMLSKLND